MASTLSLPSGLIGMAGVIADGAVMFVGGFNPLNGASVTTTALLNISASSLPATVGLLTTNTGPTAKDSLPKVKKTQCMYDSANFKVYCLGGSNFYYDKTQVGGFNSVVNPAGIYTLDMNTFAWKLVNDTSTPPCASHAAVYMDDGFIYSFGGANPNDPNYHSWDTNKINAQTGVSTSLSPPLRPDERYSACATRINSTHVFLFGGDMNVGYTSAWGDVWILNTVTATWTNMTTLAQPTPNTPLPRLFHTCATATDGSAIYVHGGMTTFVNATTNYTESAYLGDLWKLDLASYQWGLLSGSPDITPGLVVPNSPGLRQQHALVAAGNYLIVAGGYFNTTDDTQTDNRVYFYDINANSWVPSPTLPVALPQSLAYRTPQSPSSGSTSLGTGQTSTPGSSNSPSSSSGLSLGPIVGAIVGGVVFIIGIVGVVIFLSRRKSSQATKKAEELRHAQQLNESVVVMDKTGQYGQVLKAGGDQNTNGRLFGANSRSGSDPYLPSYVSTDRNHPSSGLPAVAYSAVFVPPSVQMTPLTDPGPEFDRMLSPVAVPYVNVQPNSYIVNRFNVRGSPISSENSRFLVVPAEDMQSRQQVALKLYGTNRGRATSAFRREAAMLRKLQSRHIVETKGFFAMQVNDQQSPPYIVYMTVLQLYPETLSQFIGRTANFPDLLVRTIIRSITEGLAYLASEGVVHCDIKPSNVLLVDNVFARLADFETARVAEKETVASASFAYAAPEVAVALVRNRVARQSNPAAPETAVLATHAIDMWGLGTIIYECYARRPLTAGMKEDQMIGMLSAPYDSTQPIIDGIPSNVVEPPQARNLLASLLSRNPGQRKSARAVLASAYLNAGQDTTESANSFGGLQQQIQQVGMAVDNVAMDTRAIRQQQMEICKMLIGSITNPNVPRMMALVPMGNARWDQVTWWGSNVFRLYFLCEHRDNPHFTLDPGYAIADPRPFARDLGPFLRAGFQIASIALGVGSAVASGRGVNMQVNPFQNIGVRPTEYFAKMTQLLDEINEEKDAQGRPFVARIDNRMARELEAYMQTLDPGRRCGSLQRCVDIDGSIVWLCDDHAHGLNRR